MGYFVQGSGQITIRKADEICAHKAMIDLNQRDDLKQGGSWGGEHDARNPRPEGMNYHPGKWFSWLHADYPSICHDFLSVLEMLGFEIGPEIDEEGGSTTYPLYYDGKIGQEDLFLAAISPWITGEIEWSGEDGNRWKQVFDGLGVTTKTGRVVYD